MTIGKRAAKWFLEGRSTPLLAAALVATTLAAPLAAQQRQRPSDSGNTGRSAERAGPERSAPSSERSSPPPRTAQPASPGDSEPHRQPPSRSSRDHDGGGGGRGHGHYYGGRYYDTYYPGYWGGWFGFGYPYWYYGPGAYPYPYHRGYDERSDLGALDLDVSPGRTEVYLDGQKIGTVDQYDGFPQYLWLEKGTYDLIFYRPGYQTIARQVSVYPGVVIDIDDRMERGETKEPEAFMTPATTERRDARIRYEEERRRRLEARGNDDDEDEGDDDHDDWRDRVRDDRERWSRPDRDGEVDRDHGDDDSRKIGDERVGDRGRLRLDVEPDDASVYLDGKFLGTGSEIAELRSGIQLEPGKHRVSVVRPGRHAEEREFEVEAGQEVELEIELDPAGE